MKLWRKIVSVLAGTMIVGGSAIIAISVLDTPTVGPGNAPQGPTLDLRESRAVVQSDAAAVAAWVNDTAANPAPTQGQQTQAGVVAHAFGEVSGISAPESSSSPPSSAYADSALGFSLDPMARSTRTEAAAIVGAEPATPPSADPTWSSTSVTLLVGSVPSNDKLTEQALTDNFGPTAAAVLHTPLADARLQSDGEPSDALGLKATVGDAPASVANWSTAAREEIAQRRAGQVLEDDTLNLSLASQALRATEPATADALNAQLRFRQHADGSFEDIRSTAEAARALAIGSTADKVAAVRALNWLDGQHGLAPDQAAYRLRAHAFDGELAAQGLAAERSASNAPAPMAASGASVASGPVLGLWLLVGGIGLSLSLVTKDALKGARQRLYDTVRASPGLHVNELRRRLHMSPSSIEYHLSVLVGAGLVVAEDDGRYKRYYANGAGLGLNPRAPLSRNTLGAMRRPHAVALVRALADRAGQPATARELARALSLHESAVARRLAHLEDSGVLASLRQGRARLYRLSDPAAALKALLAVEEAPPMLATTGTAPSSPLEAEAPSQVAPPSGGGSTAH